MIISCSGCGSVVDVTTFPLRCACSAVTHEPDAFETRSPISKVGTELTKLIPKLFNSPNCKCKSYAAKMDRWGVVGCEERFERIVSRLMIRARRKWFIGAFPGINEIVIRELLKRAIENARANYVPIDNGDWFVAITTAPRRDCTLAECVHSMRVAGWEPTIFAEPQSTKTDAKTFWNETRKGCWHNWLASAQYAIENTSAKVILTVQDDSLFHPDSRSFTESILWPSDDAAFVSLYTPRHYSEGRGVGVNRIATRSLWGACALAWRREVLEQVVTHPAAESWAGMRPRSGNPEVIQRRRDNPSLIANSDTAIGIILNRIGKAMWFIDPSPVTHIASYSTLSHGGNSGRRNCSRCAKHHLPLAAQVRR